MRIPIFSGERHLGFVTDQGTLARYSAAKNVSLACNRGRVVRIDVTSVSDEPDKGHGIGPNSVRPEYEEELPTGPLPMLKRVNEFGEFEKWSAKDGFNPRRFNPDLIPSTELQMSRGRA